METSTVVFIDEISIFPNAQTFIDMLRILNRFDQIDPKVKAKLECMAQAGQPMVFCNNNGV